MSRISRRLVSSGALDMVSTAVPGIRDILVLGKVKQLEREQARPTCSSSTPRPPAMPSRSSSRRAACSTPCGSGPINAQARDVLEMLTDPSRCQVVLVTLPEETPVNELVETAYSLEDEVGVSLGPVVVNGLYPELERPRRRPGRGGRRGRARACARARPTSLRAAADFRRTAATSSARRSTAWPSACPLPQLHLPYLFDAELGRPSSTSGRSAPGRSRSLDADSMADPRSAAPKSSGAP